MPPLLLRVLEVAADFDVFGGTNPAVTAWELQLSLEVLGPAWQRAVADRLLRPVDPDPIYGEELWRITGLGRLVLDLAVVRGSVRSA